VHEVRPAPARPAPVRAAPTRAPRAAHAREPAPNAQPEAHGADSSVAALAEDLAGSIADEVTRRTELLIVQQRKQASADELAIDKVRTEFDLHEQERAELLREWNSMRDLAMEQMKHDDEIVKKWIALI